MPEDSDLELLTRRRPPRRNITFPLFNDLPKDIRLNIYDRVFPPRLVYFCNRSLSRYNSPYVGLDIEPLGPPAVAQTCRETWHFARTRYLIIAYRIAQTRITNAPMEPTRVRNTWFNPRVDVLCLEFPWHDLAFREGIRLCDKKKESGEREVTNATAYSEIVHALRPFSQHAETVVVRPSPRVNTIQAYDFFPYADGDIFPRLKTVLIAVQAMNFDTRIHYQYMTDEPAPKYSVRVLDAYTTALRQQLDEQTCYLNPKRSRNLCRENKKRAKKRRAQARWCAPSPPPGSVSLARLNRRLDQDQVATFDAVNMWLRAAHYLRVEYAVGENGDRVYNSYRDWHWKDDDDPELDVEMEAAKKAGGLPVFKPVVLVHKAPLYEYPDEDPYRTAKSTREGWGMWGPVRE
ncbi:hypothetical protein F5Y11DRAFT_342610 [Daldinia sp. FL1419]|nr:hypothetical protein F5Y11DRAFT_342610 [Daldinia sp. FL1419]